MKNRSVEDLTKDNLFRFFVVIIITLTTSHTLADEPCLIINEDNSHFFTSRTQEEMTLEGLHAFIDQYEAIWELSDQKMPEGLGKQWMGNVRLLHEHGLDPYAI